MLLFLSGKENGSFVILVGLSVLSQSGVEITQMIKYGLIVDVVAVVVIPTMVLLLVPSP